MASLRAEREQLNSKLQTALKDAVLARHGRSPLPSPPPGHPVGPPLPSPRSHPPLTAAKPFDRQPSNSSAALEEDEEEMHVYEEIFDFRPEAKTSSNMSAPAVEKEDAQEVSVPRH